MSLKALPIPPIPEETARVARAAFPRGNVFMQIRDTRGTIYSDEEFADLFPSHGQPAFAPWRLALITIFQFLEHFSDRQAAEAVGDRLAWKYALSRDITASGVDHTVLSEFRSRLVAGHAEQRLLDLLFQRCHQEGWLKARGRQRTDSTHVLAKIRSLNRFLCVVQTIVYVVNVLAEVAPSWVCTHVPAEWGERYAARWDYERLPKEDEERLHLDTIQEPATPDWLKTLPAIITLARIWEQPFAPREQGGTWRREPTLPAAQLITSPYDLDARHAKKRAIFWTGYKVHLPQTCDDDAPQLITHIETTSAPTSDESVVPVIHTHLAKAGLLPEHHLVDSGYVTATNLVESHTQHQVDLVGPTHKTHWYQAETGYDSTHFPIDWEAQTATCPQGHTNSSWTEIQEAGKVLIRVRFAQKECKACPSRAVCTGTNRRTMTVQPKERTLALFAARHREETVAFKELYRHRAGIDGTHSQGVRAMGLRRSRYIGLRKTHLGHVALATAINLVRLMRFLWGEPSEQVRLSPFKRLIQQAA